MKIKKHLLFLLLFVSTNLIGQTKLDFLTLKITKSAEVDMLKVCKDKDREASGYNAVTETILSYNSVPSDLKVVVTDVDFIDGVVIIKGEYVSKLTVYETEKYIGTLPLHRDFNAKAKEVFDDFLISDFISTER